MCRILPRPHLHRAGFADILASRAAYARLRGVEAPHRMVGKVWALSPHLILIGRGACGACPGLSGLKVTGPFYDGFLPPRSQDRDGQGHAGAHRNRPFGEDTGPGPEQLLSTKSLGGVAPSARASPMTGFSLPVLGERGLDAQPKMCRECRATSNILATIYFANAARRLPMTRHALC